MLGTFHCDKREFCPRVLGDSETDRFPSPLVAFAATTTALPLADEGEECRPSSCLVARRNIRRCLVRVSPQESEEYQWVKLEPNIGRLLVPHRRRQTTKQHRHRHTHSDRPREHSVGKQHTPRAPRPNQIPGPRITHCCLEQRSRNPHTHQQPYLPQTTTCCSPKPTRCPLRCASPMPPPSMLPIPSCQAEATLRDPRHEKKIFASALPSCKRSYGRPHIP